MLIATDGACKRNGTPECSSVGVAWIMTDGGEMLYKARHETRSTSQRGEINGLIEALEYAKHHVSEEESVVIITDSEYLYNTIEKDWVHKWYAQKWQGANGAVKNPDMWLQVVRLLDSTELEGKVFMQWTKGHLISFTKRNTRIAMSDDNTGIELYDRISCVARRPADYKRIVKDFNANRYLHGYMTVADWQAMEWAVCNTVADCLAGYLVDVLDNFLPGG